MFLCICGVVNFRDLIFLYIFVNRWSSEVTFFCDLIITVLHCTLLRDMSATWVPLLMVAANKSDVRSQLALALAWNRCDIARQEIFTAENRHKWEVILQGEKNFLLRRKTFLFNQFHSCHHLLVYCLSVHYL